MKRLNRFFAGKSYVIAVVVSSYYFTTMWDGEGGFY